MSSKTDLRNLTQSELVDYVVKLGQPAFRGRQIIAWLYRNGIKDFSQMTDLAKVFRKVLSENAFFSSFDDYTTEKSADGCIKFAFKLADGKLIESVLIPEEDRNTLCISSQVGCAMGCRFCLTASMGYQRNLEPAEIVNQVLAVRDYLTAHHGENSKIPLSRITNIVFMGMGEPLNNTENLLKSLDILTEPKGLDMAVRRITVSTCGIVPEMHRLGHFMPVNLAISLHAVDNETRNRLMPINRKYPIEQLLETCRTYPIAKRKRIMFEYVMLDGINDSEQEAKILARKLRNIPCKINLLPFNSCKGLPYKGSSREKMETFQNILRKAHYSVFIRNSRGSDISAACGQLAQKQASKR
ncbi:MAG: 23S rRNA (adenine(2503)-C(2))-methyltransferase RlmN [Deltaproteobacteria bacterium]|nr:MAG: 23S rRNA (adenine(2503)-C(2))-methyltransferase RlmN [Deltaproteobacteria bacterium]